MPNNYVLSSNGNFISEDELYHWGVKGMKWGVRKKIDYAGEGIVSRKKQKLPGYVKGGPAKKSTLSTSGHARKMGDAMASAVNSARKAVESTANSPRRKAVNESKQSIAKAKTRTSKGKKNTQKVMSKVGSKAVKSLGHAAKTGLSFTQSMWNISDEGTRARENLTYLNTYSGMSPEYKRRFMYD